MSLGPFRLALLGLLVAVSAAAQPGGPGFSIPGYNEIQNNKTPVLPRRRRLNFVNGGCVDDVANASTDCTVSGSGGGAPVGAKYIVQACDPTLTAEELLTAGAGIASVEVAGDCGTLTLATASQEASFLADGGTTDLVCTTAQGKMQVMDNGTLQWCDGATGGQRRSIGYQQNVKDFGAKGDNATDDSVAIQAALDAAGPGGTVWLPTGFYRASNLQVQQGQTITGAGLGDITLTVGFGTIIQPLSAAGNQTVFLSKNQAAGCTHGAAGSPKCADGVVFRDLVAEANGSNDIVFDLTNMSETTLDHVAVFGRLLSGVTGQIGVKIAAATGPTGGLDNRITQSKIFNISTGVRIGLGNGNMIGPGDHFLGNNVAVQIDGRCTSAGCIAGGALNLCTADADCAGCGGGSCSNISNTGGVGNDIFDNVIENSATTIGVLTVIRDIGNHTRIHGNYIENGNATGTQLEEEGVDVVVTGNTFSNNVNFPSVKLTNVLAGPQATRVILRDNTFGGSGAYITETNPSTAVEVGRNVYQGSGAKVTPNVTTGVRWIDLTEQTALASLPAVADGSELFCSNCSASDPCNTTGGTGHVAERLGPAWHCPVAAASLNCTGCVGPTEIGSTAVVAASYGSATESPTFTVDVDGRLTAAANVTISGVAPAAHNFLDSTVHNNTTTGTPLRGDLITGQGGTPTWTRLVLGGTGKLIRSNGTDALYSTFTIPDTYALGDTLFASAANVLTALAGNTTATRKFLRQTGTGAVSAAPVWDTLLAGDVPSSALTKTDDTNVTLTLGGTPATALLAATSLTLGWTGQLSPTRGGTGANNTATLGRYLRGDGTNFVTSAVAAGGAGDCSGTSTFVRATNDNAAPTCNKVTLNTDTSGNYVGTLACGTGVTGCTGAIPAAAPTVGFDYTATLAGNPTLSAGQCVFSNDTSGTNKGGVICEGSGTDANEVYIGVADPTADRTITFPNASGTVVVTPTATDGQMDWANLTAYPNGTSMTAGACAAGTALTTLADSPTCTAFAPSAHNLLSTTHGDTNTGTPVTGDLVAANNGSPNKWDRFPVGSNDQHVIADSTQTKGLRWVTPSWLAQLPFDATGASFGWFPAGVQTGLLPPSTNTPANQIHCLPFAPTHTGTLGNLLITVTGGGGANCAIAVYTADTPANFLFPLTKLYGDSTAQDCSTLGGKQVSPAVTLTSGNLYWVCTWFQNSTPLRTATSAMLTPNVLGYSSDGSSPQTAWVLNKTFPASFTGSSWATSFSTLGSPSPAHNANEPIMLVNFSS